MYVSYNTSIFDGLYIYKTICTVWKPRHLHYVVLDEASYKTIRIVLTPWHLQ